MAPMSNDLITATEKTLEKLESDLEEKREVARAAQERWMSAETNVADLQAQVSRTASALAALKGEPLPEPEAPEEPEEAQPQQAPDSTDRVDVTAMTPEEFEAYNRKAGSKIKSDPNNPYDEVPCPSCNRKHSLYEGVQTMKGRPIKVLKCGGCQYTKPMF